MGETPYPSLISVQSLCCSPLGDDVDRRYNGRRFYNGWSSDAFIELRLPFLSVSTYFLVSGEGLCVFDAVAMRAAHRKRVDV